MSDKKNEIEIGDNLTFILLMAILLLSGLIC